MYVCIYICVYIYIIKIYIIKKPTIICVYNLHLFEIHQNKCVLPDINIFMSQYISADVELWKNQLLKAGDRNCTGRLSKPLILQSDGL